MGMRSFGGRLPQNPGILQCRTLYLHTGLVRTNTGSLLEPSLPALKERSKRLSAAARTILKFSQCKTLEASPSLRPLAAAYCPKVWFTSPLHYDLGRPSTRQSVLDVCCVYMRITSNMEVPRADLRCPFPTALMLGLSFKEDIFIVSPPSLLRELK